MILIVAVCSKTIFFIVAGMAGDAIVGRNAFASGGDLFDLLHTGVLLLDNVRGVVAVGGGLVSSHDGQRIWRSGGSKNGCENLGDLGGTCTFSSQQSGTTFLFDLVKAI
jgi:hypothetical protein